MKKEATSTTSLELEGLLPEIVVVPSPNPYDPTFFEACWSSFQPMPKIAEKVRRTYLLQLWSLHKTPPRHLRLHPETQLDEFMLLQMYGTQPIYCDIKDLVSEHPMLTLPNLHSIRVQSVFCDIQVTKSGWHNPDVKLTDHQIVIKSPFNVAEPLLDLYNQTNWYHTTNQFDLECQRQLVAKQFKKLRKLKPL